MIRCNRTNSLALLMVDKQLKMFLSCVHSTEAFSITFGHDLLLLVFVVDFSLLQFYHRIRTTSIHIPMQTGLISRICRFDTSSINEMTLTLKIKYYCVCAVFTFGICRVEYWTTCFGSRSQCDRFFSIRRVVVFILFHVAHCVCSYLNDSFFSVQFYIAYTWLHLFGYRSVSFNFI